MRTFKSKKALTLIELIITVILVSILLVAISMVYLGGFRAAYSQIKRGGTKGEAGRVFWNLAQELRQVTSLTTAETANLVFTLDSDSDGVDESVQYTWGGVVGNPFNRVQVSPLPSYTIPVVNSVSSLTFTYYNAANNVTVTLSEVRAVLLNIVVTDGDETFHLRSAIKLRTL